MFLCILIHSFHQNLHRICSQREAKNHNAVFTGDFFVDTHQTRIDVFETLCPQQMLVHKGGKIKNWGGECRDVTPTKLQSQNIFKESIGGGAVGLVGSGWM